MSLTVCWVVGAVLALSDRGCDARAAWGPSRRFDEQRAGKPASLQGSHLPRCCRGANWWFWAGVEMRSQPDVPIDPISREPPL